MGWDQTAVLVAVKGYEPYYTVERGTFRITDDRGSNSWTPGSDGRHYRLIEKVPAEQMAQLIASLYDASTEEIGEKAVGFDSSRILYISSLSAA